MCILFMCLGIMIDVKLIEERKVEIQKDIETLEKKIAEIGEQQKQVQANVFALHGALQQCDQFLEVFNEENEKDG